MYSLYSNKITAKEDAKDCVGCFLRKIPTNLLKKDFSNDVKKDSYSHFDCILESQNTITKL